MSNNHIHYKGHNETHMMYQVVILLFCTVCYVFILTYCIQLSRATYELKLYPLTVDIATSESCYL